MNFELKRIRSLVVFFLVLSFFVPSLAFGQSVSSQYCPNPAKDFFKGSIHYEKGEPWIETIVDPDFEQKVLRGERKIGGDIPLTPVYDLVVRIKPEFNYYCIPGWAGNTSGGAITADKLPPYLHVTASLVVGTKDEVVVDPVVFSRTDEQDAQGRFIYERKIKGWKSGITSPDKLARLIDEIDKSKWLIEQGLNISAVNVVVSIKKTDNTTESIKSPVSMSACVPFWGGGQHKIVGMYDLGTSPDMVLSYFDSIRQSGFNTIEPYASNQNYFSYFVDLKQVIDGDITPIAKIVLDAKQNGFRRPTISSQNNILEKYINKSSCKNGIYLLKLNSTANSLPFGLGGVALLGASVRGALIDTEGAQIVAGSRGSSDVGIIYVHEFSHTFAGLNDEYIYKSESVIAGLPLKNCSVRPQTDFSYQGKTYGSSKYKGCSFLYDTGHKPSVNSNTYYRPSNKSVMNVGGDEFNIVSCGYILSAIKGGDAHSYFPECSRMNGIIKEGVTAQNFFTPVLTWFNNVVSSPTSLTAQVGSSDATVNMSENSPYLLVESFDPSDPWGGIIEVDSDTSPITASESGTVIKDPLDEIFADFESASFPIFDPELFDALEQELLALGEAEPTLWQKFLGLFSSDDEATSISGTEAVPPAPLVSIPNLSDAKGATVRVGGSTQSGKMTLTGIVSVPKDESLSEVKNTFQYASGQGTFVDWVSFTFPEGLEPGDTATDTYTWQAGAGDWRFRLCMDSKEKGRTCGAETSVTIVGSLPQTSAVATSCGGTGKLIPTVPSLSGSNAGAGKLRAGMMKVSTSITNKTGAEITATSGRFEYSQDGKNFTPWVNFSVPALSPCAKSSTSYSWEGGEGRWFMRACIGAECSAHSEVQVVP